MKLPPRHSPLPMVVITVLVVVAVIAAAVRGSATSAVPAVLVGGLLLAYLGRHRIRARQLYDRREEEPARRTDTGHHSRPGPVTSAKE